MPELPEVEIIACALHDFLQGRMFRDLTICYPKCIHGEVQEYRMRVLGRQVLGVQRRGKLVIISLSGGFNLLFHLKMTGKLLFYSHGEGLADRDTRLLFHLEPQAGLCFKDMRKFGYTRCLTDLELEQWPFYRDLGPDPLQVGEEEFSSLFEGKRAQIKGLLLNQKVISGIGNIYADEALFLAGIHPAARVDRLEAEDFSKLLAALQAVLHKALKCGGSSFRDYVNSLGERGGFQDHFQVYGRSGEQCKRCGEILERTRVAGRGTVFCPVCQPIK